MAEFLLTPAALRDLEDIWRYTARQWREAQAARYLDILNAGFEASAMAPLVAPACDHVRPGYRRQRIGNHVVYFKIGTDRVTGVRVLHERMDAPRHL